MDIGVLDDLRPSFLSIQGLSTGIQLEARLWIVETWDTDARLSSRRKFVIICHIWLRIGLENLAHHERRRGWMGYTSFKTLFERRSTILAYIQGWNMVENLRIWASLYRLYRLSFLRRALG